MKPATQGKDIIRNDNGDIIGINIGYDYAAEHEWGIEFASRYLGRDGTPRNGFVGIACRTTTGVFEGFELELVAFKGELWLRGQRNYYDRKLIDELKGPKEKRPYALNGMMNPWRDEDIRSAWSGDSGFIVVGKSEDVQKAIRMVYEALVSGNCFINQASGFLGRGGLCFVPVDNVPAEYFEEMAVADYARLKLENAVEADGILHRLKKAGKGYYACSPRWANEEQTEFNFWLNPQDQKFNRYGWVSVEDLDDWIAGKGRIPYPDNRDSYAGCVS